MLNFINNLSYKYVQWEDGSFDINFLYYAELNYSNLMYKYQNNHVSSNKNLSVRIFLHPNSISITFHW